MTSIALPAARERRRLRLSARARRNLAGWGFSLPFLILYAVFELVPVVAALGFSFTDLRSRDLLNPLNVDPVGTANYARLLSDDVFWQAIANTLYFAAVTVPLTIVIGMALAFALNSGINRLKTFFRVSYYLPVVSSIVAIAVIFRYLLGQEIGLVNVVLGWFGIDGPNWLMDPFWAMPSLIGMAVWRHVGFVMVIYLAGLQSIPGELYEASSIDGASARQRFWHVTLPLLRPTTLFLVIVSVIGNLQFFEEPFVMTGGGPLHRTTSISFLIYDTFGTGQYGYAAAISYVLFLVIALLSVVQFRLLRSTS
ncbi:sugar ABC transporter permease [Nonomuraea sp. NBC_01738]|uniref:carbohydrate ABC transporter permease n=1 Tax=Nonomuraea sp. NBC_01738 TaxID=2976003 RepID=UPI002E163FF5|nr:sugar ABC transporter permease [Nonomuraea sp. NBC_01738]